MTTENSTVKFIDKLTGKLFSLVVSLFFLWVVVQIGIIGYQSVYEDWSGITAQRKHIQSFYDTIDVIIRERKLDEDDLIRIFEYHIAESEGYLSEIGIVDAYENYLVIRLYYDAKNLGNENEDNVRALTRTNLTPLMLPASNTDLYKANLEALKQTVATLKVRQPYTNLPLREKLALENLDEALKNLGSDDTKKHFENLKLVIEQRYEEYKQIDLRSEQNLIFSWISISLAVLALVLPLVGWRKIIGAFRKDQNGMSKED